MERDFLIEAYYAQEHDENESLTHHGIKGQHWGIRRYQNTDGSLTPEGRRHWGIGDAIRGAKTNVQKYVKSKKAAALRNKKNSILARGDVNEILKNKHLFTTNELDKAISRTQRMSMLEAMTPEKAAQRKKEAEAQAKAARGKEAVDRTLYRAGQLVQMAPAMIQCYAIVRGLLGHGGSALNASQVASTAATAAQALANPLAPVSGANQNGSSSHNQSNNGGQNPYNHSITNPYTSSHIPAPSQIHAQTTTSNANPLHQISYNLASDTSKKTTKYTSSAHDTHNYTAIDTSTLPSWSNPTTNAVFTDCMHTAETVPINSLANSTLFSDNKSTAIYPALSSSSGSTYNLDFD